MGKRTETRVLIVDDHRVVREGIRALLEGEGGFEIVGEAANGEEAIELARTLRPGLVVLDHEMPRRRGLEVLAVLRRELPDTRVVMFSLEMSVRERGLALGATAFLEKGASGPTIVETLCRAVGRAPRSRGSAGRRSISTSTIRGWQRAPLVVAGLVLAYIATFTVTEPLLGASSAALSLVPVALAGALLGPEIGLLTAMVTTIVTAVLWAASGHPVGEPILRIGSNGLGILMLLAVGAAFGAMREIGGRLGWRGRTVSGLAAAARGLARAGDSERLGLLVDAALQVVPGHAALLYVPVDRGSVLEVVAATSAARATIGRRQSIDLGPVNEAFRDATPRITADPGHISAGSIVEGTRSAIVVPVGDRPGECRGVLVVLGAREGLYSVTHTELLRALIMFVWLALEPGEAIARTTRAEPRHAS